MIQSLPKVVVFHNALFRCIAQIGTTKSLVVRILLKLLGMIDADHTLPPKWSRPFGVQAVSSAYRWSADRSSWCTAASRIVWYFLKIASYRTATPVNDPRLFHNMSWWVRPSLCISYLYSRIIALQLSHLLFGASFQLSLPQMDVLSLLIPRRRTTGGIPP